jgi:putative ABC transport system permease protein
MNWIRQIFSRRQLRQDLADEIQEHLEEKIDEFVQRGMSRDDAAAAAYREFGNVTRLQERGRDIWRWPSLEDFLADVRFALRQLRKSPTFALATILTLALGIGANTAVFSVINAVVLRPLPYPEPERLVSVESRDIRGAPHPTNLSYPTFFDFRRENKVFEHIVSYRDSEFSLTGTGRPLHLRGEIVSWDLFSMLGVRPALGRGFLPQEEEASERVVILSHQLWQGPFGADATIVGRTVMIDSQPHTVVGIAPQGFNFPIGGAPVQIWTTVARDAASATVTPVTKQRGARMLNAMARLKKGISIDQAQAQLDTVAASLARRYPDSNRNVRSTYVRPELETLAGNTRAPLLILLGAVGLVLLVACANIANLLLTRTAERAREFAVRTAIGAGRGRLVRQLITESLTLSFIGCTLGVLLSIGIMRLILPLAGDGIPRIQEATMDSRVLLFSTALAVVTSLLFGLAPVLRTVRPSLSDALKEGSRTTTDGADVLRSALCVGQIALGLVLLSGASLLIASFLHLMRRDLGFQPRGLLAFSVNLPDRDYPRQRQADFYTRLLENLNSIPGVASAAAAMPLPLTGSQMTVSFNIQDRPEPPADRPRSDMAIVTPGYFRSIGAPLLQGRDFSEQDDANAAPVLIVNQAFSERFFPGENAVRKRIEPGATSEPGGSTMREIVGVVGNAKQSALLPGAEPIYYFPYQQLPWCCPSVLVRGKAAPLRLEPAIRSAVASLDKQLPIYDVRTLEAILGEDMARPRFQMILLGSFAAIALLLTVVGLYGVLTYSVVRRKREIGVRIALGASRGEVISLVLKRAALLVLLGLSLGLGGAFAGGQILSKMLYGVAPQNPLLLAVACSVLGLTAALAAYSPARRAASIDPMESLRAE